MLEILNIGNNKISDSFPRWTKTLPDLQVLILRANHFYGVVESFKTESSFPKLKILDIANNKLCGHLSTFYFEHFKAMMSANDKAFGTKSDTSEYYEASVSPVFKGHEYEIERNLRLFRTIDLSCNKFQGDIPSSIGKLISLRFLNLSYNSFAGNIPPSLEKLSNLESLDLSSNQIIGEIPKSMIQLTFLAVLNLSYNELIGQIPHGGQFNTFENDSYIGNSALCGLPLTNTCEDQAQDPEEEEDSNSLFDLDAALIGYGFGTIIGLAIGSLMLSYGKLNWIGNIVRGRKQRKRRGITLL